MAFFKIKNICDTLGKRDINKDRVVDIEYSVGFQKKTYKLNSGDEVVISCKTLPVSVRSLRVKELITVQEIDEHEFHRLQKPSAKKVEKKNSSEITTTTTTTAPPVKVTKKKKITKSSKNTLVDKSTEDKI